MIVCPVCEAQQAAGSVCDNCGKQLVPAAPVNVVAEILPELEPTFIPNGKANVAADHMAELEVHRVAPVTVQTEAVPDVERTAFGKVAVTPDVMPDIEATHFQADGQKTVLTEVISCRYCGNQQRVGLICDKCGMKLSKFMAPLAKPKASATLTCTACGVQATPGKKCQACGVFMRSGE